MLRNLVLTLFLLPLSAFAQSVISGRILNQADTKPLANANVFLSNATIGDKTVADGTFTLRNVKYGKYDLVVSIVGFETYRQTILVNTNSVKLPDILIFPKTIGLKEVKIKPEYDPNWDRNYSLFKDEFLGTSALAKECKILNPELLDLKYDENTKTLTATSVDFLEIENRALGYRVRYLLTSFTKDNSNYTAQKLFYLGSALFLDLKGTPAQEKQWQKNRLDAYRGSEMHFLRAALANRIEDEGFRAFQYATIPDLRPGKTSKPDKSVKKLLNYPLSKKDIVKTTDLDGIYSLGCDLDGIHITYDKNHHLPKKGRMANLDNINNKEATLLTFNAPYLLFDNNGGVVNPGAIYFSGIWGRSRIAELLPVDYEPPAGKITNNDVEAPSGVAAKLANYIKGQATEKAYFHFDKPYYAAGDTLYFKAYVTLGARHELSGMSGVLYADLINTINKVDQSIKLQVTDGLAWGDFALPDSLPKGNYRVRAYTNWMRNNGANDIFEQTIAVGSIKSTRVSEAVASQPKGKADIQFFAEGGQLVSGIRTKIAFKAIGNNGLGMDVKGIVTDNENNEVATFASTHLGMGYFYLNAIDSKTYKAKLTFADGRQNTVDLPKPIAKGITMSVNNDSIPKASVRIEAGKAFFGENKGKEFKLVIYSGGIAATVPFRLDSAVIAMDILKRRLFTGVATITLFSPADEPLAERLLFVQNYDKLSIGVQADKADYLKRGRVNIKLTVKDRAENFAKGHFSVSVVDESKVPVEENNEHTILTDLLLTSDLNGYVEQPNYYFANITDQTSKDLDVLMLTQGYRRFEWKRVLNDDIPATYRAEKGLEVSGVVKTVLGKLVANGTVTLINRKTNAIISETTDDKGAFRFSNLSFADSSAFILQAVTDAGKNDTKIIYNKDSALPVIAAVNIDAHTDVNSIMSQYLENIQAKHEDQVRYGTIKGKLLNEVTIKGTKSKYPPARSTQLVSPEFSDQVVLPEQMAKAGPFSGRIEGVLHGVRIMRDPQTMKAYPVSNKPPFRPMLVILDGVVMNFTDGKADLDEILGDEVESVEVLTSAGTAGVYGIRGADGAIIVTSKPEKGLQAMDIVSTGILPITPKGYYKARAFYSPKYEATMQANGRADRRSTIFWQPELLTDEDGNAAFAYDNADGKGTYRIIIEGIDDKGNLGRQVYRYTVQ